MFKDFQDTRDILATRILPLTISIESFSSHSFAGSSVMPDFPSTSFFTGLISRFENKLKKKKIKIVAKKTMERRKSVFSDSYILFSIGGRLTKWRGEKKKRKKEHKRRKTQRNFFSRMFTKMRERACERKKGISQSGIIRRGGRNRGNAAPL